MDRRLIELHVQNFRSLRNVTIPLGPVNVLVGPNGAGKTNVLEVFRFLADVIRTDLEPALDQRGGLEEILFWGGSRRPESLLIRIRAAWTRFSSVTAPDEYGLTIRPASHTARTARGELFQFNRSERGGRRSVLVGQEKARIIDHEDAEENTVRTIGLRELSSGLSTLPRLSDDDLAGTEVATVADRLRSFRVFDVNVNAARRPSRIPNGDATLDDDAGNLSAFLSTLPARENVWQCLVEDARRVLPNLDGIEFEYTGGASHGVAVVLRERGLRRPTQLADASYGTVRLLGLLAMLYDPNPPALTCVEEIDHGLHPQALELLVERVRETSERTQFLIATHSPALADRLRPDELIVCERRDDGSSAIPAVSRDHVEEIVAASEGLPLGRLWFSGALGGDL